jgi:predicted Zn-ribbon and HTH transcriptional regulator
VKIRGTCANCGREFLPEQVIDAGGHCPWCGKAFNRDYTALLVQALRQADQAGDDLEAALKDMASIEELAMDIDEDSVLEPLREAFRTLRRRRARV